MTRTAIAKLKAKVYGAGRYREAATVTDLVTILLHYWPIADGPAFVNALVVCQEVLDGDKLPEKAREAFVLAAREARIAILPDDAC